MCLSYEGISHSEFSTTARSYENVKMTREAMSDRRAPTTNKNA